MNSGIRTKNREQENNSFEVNINAADEIARQIRLRDMGGIVVIDFIDMDSNEHRNLLYKHMTEVMSSDRAKHTILPLTRFGLMQITRQRVRPTKEIETAEVCPACSGTGKIGPTLLIDETLERELAFYVKEKKIKEFILRTSPILAAYLTKGLLSIRYKWSRKYGCTIKVIGDTDYSIIKTRWFDRKGDPLD